MPQTCIHPDCNLPVTGVHIACTDHWRKLPSRVRAEAQQRIHAWKDKGAAREFVLNWLRSQKKEGHAL